jgi:hypothetical protein
MDNLIVDVQDGQVMVIAVPGHQQAFRDAAKALAAAGQVTTATGPRGIALVADEQTAKKAGVIKAARTTRKKA